MISIQIENLTKSYDGVQNALDALTLNVPEGGVFGFLGPNGAGKTTTVKLLCGLLRPTSGGSRVLGVDPAADPVAVHAACGLLTETAQMYDHMTAEQNLVFYGSLYSMDRADLKKRVSELLHTVGLADAKDKVKTFSTGMRKRLSMARVLLHRPRVLFLDEPTSGLDPESAQEMTQLVSQQAQKEGVTVFLCTHQLRYAQDICTQYGLIAGGKLLKNGTFQELLDGTGQKPRVRVHGTLPDGWLRRVSEGVYETDMQRERIPQMLRELIDAGASIYEVICVQPTLEELYFAYLGRGNGHGNGNGRQTA